MLLYMVQFCFIILIFTRLDKIMSLMLLDQSPLDLIICSVSPPSPPPTNVVGSLLLSACPSVCLSVCLSAVVVTLT